ncbi:MAG: hypothetical protein KAJ40_01990, partial [Alphaproteobacteria bacterium]|nr:hypothetical protein [Alphaproteobacteria bacterium]
MADATTNPQTSSSQQIENKAELKDQTGTLTYSEEPCEVSADQIGEYLAIVPLENELDIVPVETGETVDGAEQAKAQTGEPQIVEDDVEAPSLEELKTALKEALIEQENDNDNDDVAAIEPAAGEDAQAQPQSQSDAQSVAEIEPEAGGEDNSANGITSSSRGYGFQSNFQAQGVIGLDDVGPIDPTALQYGVTQTEELLFIQEQKSLPDLNPHFIDTTTEHYIYEDDSVLANAIIKGESSNSTLTITISGIPSGWTCSDGAYDNSGNRVGDGSYDASTGIWTVTIGASLYYGGPILTPPADSDIDALSLTYSVVEADSITGQTGSDSIEFDVFVDAVADMPDVDGKDIVGNEGATLAINITGLTGEEVNNGAGNDDGSEDILHYYLFGALVGFTLSAGTETYAGSGVYMLDPSELANLTITPDDSNYSGSIDLVVTVSTSEIPVSDVDFDSSNDDAQALDVFTLKWIADADKPSLCVNDVEVKEDGAVFVPVSAQLADTDGSEYLTITVSGIPASWNLTGSGWMLVAGTTDTYEIMVSAGLDYADGFTVYPPADSDVDLNGITVTAT